MSDVRKTVAIVQSNYIPWKGYFDLIGMVDEFILFDDRQYTRRDWRNRNRIKTPRGPRWLTIPVEVKGRYFQRIDETLVSDARWARAHWMQLSQNYSRAAHFAEYRAMFEELYLRSDERRLSHINHRFLVAVCAVLGIGTTFSWASDYDAPGGQTERLVNLCLKAGAGEYVSGPSAKAYLQEQLFREAGIGVSYMDYSGYPEYEQLFPPFEHQVTILDLIFNVGAEARRHLKTFARTASDGA